MSLRKELIKLAHEKPELREHLLPLVTKQAEWIERNDVVQFIEYVSKFYLPSHSNVLYPYYKGRTPLTKKVLTKVILDYVKKENPQYLESV